LTDNQKATLDKMEAAGAITGAARGLDDALFWLEQRGLLR
jgi:hypothetical protein